MVASVRKVEDLEPLPNIDFNILPGNSLVGLMRVDEHASSTAKSNGMTQMSLFQTGSPYAQPGGRQKSIARQLTATMRRATGQARQPACVARQHRQ
jgi:hypothetical protein